MMLKPKFIRISAVAVTDMVSGGQIPICFAVDESGRIWQKVGINVWELINDFNPKDLETYNAEVRGV